MNTKWFHMLRLANKNLQCFLRPLVPFLRLPLQDAIKKSVWDCWARGCGVGQKKWHWFLGSPDTTVLSGQAVVVACFKFKCKKEKANTGATAFHLEYSPVRKEKQPLVLLLSLLCVFPYFVNCFCISEEKICLQCLVAEEYDPRDMFEGSECFR
jgi:hypothetical protein